MEVMAIIGALAMLVGIVIIAPFINFAEGWIVGHLIKWVFGATFVSGLAMLGINISPRNPYLSFVASWLSSAVSLRVPQSIKRKTIKSIFGYSCFLLKIMI